MLPALKAELRVRLIAEAREVVANRAGEELWRLASAPPLRVRVSGCDVYRSLLPAPLVRGRLAAQPSNEFASSVIWAELAVHSEPEHHMMHAPGLAGVSGGVLLSTVHSTQASGDLVHFWPWRAGARERDGGGGGCGGAAGDGGCVGPRRPRAARHHPRHAGPAGD